tara:strand:+ start:163 stop:531 length:369 start_codon:yes stop_codon:yes gene_type:complete
MAAANLVNIDTVVGKSISGVLSPPNSGSITHNVSTGNETWLVKSLILGNNNPNSKDCQTDVYLNTDGTNRYILYRTWVPYGTTLVVLDGSLPIYLQYQDYITVSAVEGSGLNYIFKYETLRE